MFREFHSYLASYENHRFCLVLRLPGCIGLSLKVITHYGEFTEYNVKSFNKLIGKDIIIAHQLLKNDIVQHEYWLLTQSLSEEKQPGALAKWMQWNSSVKKVEDGEIPFHYTQLSQLKNEVAPTPQLRLEIPDKVKVLSLSKEYTTDIIMLFHATGDFNYRHRWQEGVRRVEEVTHFLPRVGMKCRRIMDSGETIVYASSYTFTPGKIDFSETDENKKNAIYFLLEDIGAGRVRLTIDTYIARNPIRQLFFSGERRKRKEMLQRSMLQPEQLLKCIDIPGTE